MKGRKNLDQERRREKVIKVKRPQKEDTQTKVQMNQPYIYISDRNGGDKENEENRKIAQV